MRSIPSLVSRSQVPDIELRSTHLPFLLHKAEYVGVWPNRRSSGACFVMEQTMNENQSQTESLLDSRPVGPERDTPAAGVPAGLPLGDGPDL